MKISIKESNKYDEFRNNVFSRFDSNQRIARKLWDEHIKNMLSEYHQMEFKIEWSHYMIGEIDTNTFADYFKSYVTKYFI